MKDGEKLLSFNQGRLSNGRVTGGERETPPIQPDRPYDSGASRTAGTRTLVHELIVAKRISRGLLCLLALLALPAEVLSAAGSGAAEALIDQRGSARSEVSLAASGQTEHSTLPHPTPNRTPPVLASPDSGDGATSGTTDHSHRWARRASTPPQAQLQTARAVTCRQHEGHLARSGSLSSFATSLPPPTSE